MKAFLNWSGGKDSTFCLYEANRQGMPPQALVTTIGESTQRISMHGVPVPLLRQQAAAIGLPLHTIALPDGASMEVYEEAIHHSNKELLRQGFDTVLSGDLFLADLKTYREELYGRDGLQAAFPLWKRDTTELLRRFIELGFKAVVVCINEAFLDRSFCGRLLDESFLRDLPAGVDPCGENGEYHSFVFDGPVFSTPVRFHQGGLVYRTYTAPSSGRNCFKDADDKSLSSSPSAEARQPPSFSGNAPSAKAGFYFCDLSPA